MKCLTWNLEWAPPLSKRGGLINKQIVAVDADVICFTEVIRAMVPKGYSIEADADYGYPNDGTRRKVLLWSRQPWAEIDTCGASEMPPGRFASGTTGGIRFVGVCIPWRDAHVATGRRDKSPWEEHISYCHGLAKILAGYAADNVPTCVIGDYNQRIPRAGQPLTVERALADAIPTGFKIATQGMRDSEGKSLIDHFAVSPQLEISTPEIIPRFAHDGTRLSDHVGIAASLYKHKQQF